MAAGVPGADKAIDAALAPAPACAPEKKNSAAGDAFVDVPCAGSGGRRIPPGSKRRKALGDLHNRIYRRKIPVILAYEGWDAAGKGGNIKRLAAAWILAATRWCPSPRRISTNFPALSMALLEPHSQNRAYRHFR